MATTGIARPYVPFTEREAESWKAWRLGENGSDVLPLDATATLDDALKQVMAQPMAKGATLALLHSHAGRNLKTLYLFTVKQSTKTGRWRSALDGGRPVFEGQMQAHLIRQFDVSDFDPVLRFDAFRDCPVGNDPQLIEGRVSRA